MTAPTKNLKWVAASMFGVLVTTAIALAQNPLPGTMPAMQPQTPQAINAQNQNKDAQLAAWLIVDNQGEIALGKLAEERSQNDGVKKFAQRMVDEHTKFLDKLQKFSSQEARAAATAQHAMAAQNAGTLDAVELKQRIGQKCLESARSEMEKKSGVEFDKCYLGQQIGAHMMVLDTLEVFKDYASPDLRSVLDDGITTTQEHLKHAKDLMQRVEKNTSNQTSDARTFGASQ